jgi:2-C-methyl-D-erythritol 4-phosphate cytidylyltransferase
MLGLIVVCSGRAHALRELHDVPLAARAIAAGLPADDGIYAVAVVEPGTSTAFRSVLERFALDEVEHVVEHDGCSMKDAVSAGLAQLPAEITQVLVTDAHHVLVPTAVLGRVVAALKAGQSAVVPVVTAPHVVADEDGALVRVEARARLRTLQGPLGVTRAALEAVVARDASHLLLTEALADAGTTVSLIDGDADNTAIDSDADFARAVDIFARRIEDYAFLIPADALPADPLS